MGNPSSSINSFSKDGPWPFAHLSFRPIQLAKITLAVWLPNWQPISDHHWLPVDAKLSNRSLAYTSGERSRDFDRIERATIRDSWLTLMNKSPKPVETLKINLPTKRLHFSTMDGMAFQDVLKAIVGYEVVGTMSSWDRGLPMIPHPERRAGARPTDGWSWQWKT